MSVESPTITELTVNDNLLLIAQYVCMNWLTESKLGERNRWFDWEGDRTIFTPAIGINAKFNKEVIAQDAAVVEANLSLTDEDMTIGVRLDSTETLNDDPFAAYIRDKIELSFAKSPYNLSFDGLLQKLTTQRQKALLQTSELESAATNPDEPAFKMTNRRSSPLVSLLQ